MATKRKPGTGSSLIYCERCGEYYSDIYRRCPFCEEYAKEHGGRYEDGEESPTSRGGGKRLAQGSRRGGGYAKPSPLKIISIAASLAVILAAIWIVVTIIMPLIQKGDVDPVDPDAGLTPGASVPPVTVSDEVSPAPDTSEPAAVSPSAAVSAPPDTSPAQPASPSPSASSAPVSGGATGFSLNKSEFTFSDTYPDPVTLTVTFTPAGTTGQITWSSSNSDIVSVDGGGRVSHGVRTGTATITATLSNGAAQTCKVHNEVSSSSSSGGGSPSQSAGAAGSGSYSVNNPDFTFDHVGETYQLKVKGYSGGVTWSSSDTSIATVGADGTCTAVGTGTGACTVTGTLDDGSKVEAIVRIHIP